MGVIHFRRHFKGKSTIAIWRSRHWENHCRASSPLSEVRSARRGEQESLVLSRGLRKSAARLREWKSWHHQGLPGLTLKTRSVKIAVRVEG